jgi:hypothetical protein
MKMTFHLNPIKQCVFTSPLAGEVKNEWHLAIHSRERGVVGLARKQKIEAAALLFYIPLSPKKAKLF